MNDFQAMVTSMMENAVDYIGKSRLLRLSVEADPGAGSAQIEIVLQDNSWASQSLAIDRMIELRSMFLDELSFEYAFLEADEADDAEHVQRRPELSYACYA